MHHTHKHHIRTETLLQRLGLKSCQHYFDSRMLRWAGHLARMPPDRLPRKFLTSWVADKARPQGRPSASWVTTLEAVLVRKGIPTEFAEWTELSQDRSEWLVLLNANGAAGSDNSDS
jgi:transcription termination factor 2